MTIKGKTKTKKKNKETQLHVKEFGSSFALPQVPWVGNMSRFRPVDEKY